MQQHVPNNEALTALRERLARRLGELERLEDFTNGATESQLQHRLWEQYNNAKNHIYNMRDRLEILPDVRRTLCSARRKLNEADIPNVIKVTDKRKTAEGVTSKRKQFVAILNGHTSTPKQRHQTRNKDTKAIKNE